MQDRASLLLRRDSSRGHHHVHAIVRCPMLKQVKSCVLNAKVRMNANCELRLCLQKAHLHACAQRLLGSGLRELWGVCASLLPDKLLYFHAAFGKLHRQRCCNARGPAWAGEHVNRAGYLVSASARRRCAQEPVDEVEGEGAEPAPAPLDAVLEPEPPADGLAACLPLFTAGSGHRRFVRTLKPVAGSSFKARPQKHGAGAGSLWAPRQ